jgi:hypothetical protein
VGLSKIGYGLALTGSEYGTVTVSLSVVMNLWELQSEAEYFIGELAVISK